MTRAGDKRKSELALSKQDEQKKQLKREAELLVKDFNEIFGSEAGKRVLRWIMDASGYQKSNVVYNPTSGEVQASSTIYNEARRIFYLNIRKFLRRDILSEVENRGLERDETDNLFS